MHQQFFCLGSTGPETQTGNTAEDLQSLCHECVGDLTYSAHGSLKHLPSSAKAIASSEAERERRPCKIVADYFGRHRYVT